MNDKPVTEVNVALPVGPSAGGFVPSALRLTFTPRQRAALDRLLQGGVAAGTQEVVCGHKLQGHAGVLYWILDQVADTIDVPGES